MENLKIKVADMGLAEKLNKQEKNVILSGTPGFIAPEVISRSGYNEKCDVFSAGVVLFFILTGETPFKHSNMEEVMRLNRECNLDLLNRNEFLSDLDKVFLRELLEPCPNRRLTV